MMYQPTSGPEGPLFHFTRCDDNLDAQTWDRSALRQSSDYPTFDLEGAVQPFAILCLDFDQLDDGYSDRPFHRHRGSEYSDRLLRSITRALRSRLREDDIISQVSETRFVVALRSDPLDTVPQVASRLAKTLNKPIQLGDRNVQMRLNIGVSFYPDDGLDNDALIQKANVAVNRAKQADGTWNIKLYPSDTSEAIHRRLLIEQALQHSDLLQQLEILYQPQWDYQNQCVYGFEGLVRWHHPVMGEIPPSEFIPIAEDIGSLHRITHLAIKESLQLTREILAQYDRVLKPSVNVSAHEFAEFQQLYRIIDQELYRARLPGNLLTVELTERVFLNPSEQINAHMKQLRDRGIQITLDDFGTGFSCLNYLLDLPLNMLKIDRAFVTHIDQDSRRHGVVQAIVTMARSLEMQCLAEGVETGAELGCLRALGCHLMQGHLVSPALSKSSFLNFLTQSEPTERSQYCQRQHD